MLITVAQTTAFTVQAKAVGMSQAEIDHAIDIVAANPTGGESLGAGLYKVRVPRSGGGKSGGYRIITVFVSTDAPAVLVGVLSKSNQANFSHAALENMKSVSRTIRKGG
jgi:hypothetical protein